MPEYLCQFALLEHHQAVDESLSLNLASCISFLQKWKRKGYKVRKKHYSNFQEVEMAFINKERGGDRYSDCMLKEYLLSLRSAEKLPYCRWKGLHKYERKIKFLQTGKKITTIVYNQLSITFHGQIINIYEYF